VGAEGGISRCVVVVAGAHFHAVVGVDVDVAGGVRARRAVLSEFLGEGWGDGEAFGEGAGGGVDAVKGGQQSQESTFGDGAADEEVTEGETLAVFHLNGIISCLGEKVYCEGGWEDWKQNGGQV